MDLLNTALSGMMSAEGSLNASASRIAQAGADNSVDLPTEAVNQVMATQQFAASAAVVRLSSDMWRTLLQTQESSQQR
jgi:flagellar hook protein FlgE